MQESSYKMNAVNTRTGDYGIGQINHKNIAAMKLDPARLMTDLEYSVNAAAMILASYKRYAKNEPHMWFARYNCGVRSMDKIGHICDGYKNKVARFF